MPNNSNHPVGRVCELASSAQVGETTKGVFQNFKFRLRGYRNNLEPGIYTHHASKHPEYGGIYGTRSLKYRYITLHSTTNPAGTRLKLKLQHDLNFVKTTAKHVNSFSSSQ